MNLKKAVKILITILLCCAFAGASAVMFIHGDRFITSAADWMPALYALSATLFCFGLFMVLFPKAVFKMIYNKYTVESMEKSDHGYVAPEYMAKHFFMKFRWGLMGVGNIIVALLALLAVVL
ncbi:MAG: hypothetical protein J1F71_02660 [Clostridiales bacterium]|nr:hypothetical protein [Clostridiales bacterium]